MFSKSKSVLLFLLGTIVISVATIAIAQPSSAAAGAPSAPLDITARPGVNQAKVYWAEPATSGDSAITGYNAMAYPGGQTCTVSSTAKSCYVPGLTNGVSYTFTVTAVNASGTSGPSTPSNSVTPAQDTRAPQLVSASVAPSRVSSLGGTVMVELRITDDISGRRTPSGSLDANPAISFSKCSGCASVGFTRSVNRISGDEYDGIYRATVTIPSGTAAGAWDLLIYPIDDNADNSTSFIRKAGALMVGTPAAPTGVTATVDAARTVTLNWTPPGDNGGNVITGYRVTVSPGGASFETTETIWTQSFANHPASQPVTFAVAAVNAAGSSPDTLTGPVTIPASPPSPPQVQALTPGDGQIKATWSAPTATGGDPNITYTITASPGDHSCATTATQCTLTGLTNGTYYTFNLIATNSAGDSASATAGPVPAYTKPSAPGTPTVSLDGTTATLAWTEPATDGGFGIDGYVVRAYDTTVGGTTQVCSTGPELTCQATGMSNRHTYTFTVVAQNDVAGLGTASAQSAPVLVDVSGPSAATSGPAWKAVLASTTTVSWTASDPSGISSWQVWQASAAAGKPFGEWTMAPSTSSSVTLALAPGMTKCVGVAAVDGRGNLGPVSPPVCRTAPVDDRSGSASGIVRRLIGSAYVRSTATQLSGTRSMLKFSGVRAGSASLVATTCATCGSVHVFYGTQLVKTISLSSSDTRHKRIFALPSAASTSVITLRPTSSKKVLLDGLVLRAR